MDRQVDGWMVIWKDGWMAWQVVCCLRNSFVDLVMMSIPCFSAIPAMYSLAEHSQDATQFSEPTQSDQPCQHLVVVSNLTAKPNCTDCIPHCETDNEQPADKNDDIIHEGVGVADDACEDSLTVIPDSQVETDASEKMEERGDSMCEVRETCELSGCHGNGSSSVVEQNMDVTATDVCPVSDVPDDRSESNIPDVECQDVELNCEQHETVVSVFWYLSSCCSLLQSHVTSACHFLY